MDVVDREATAMKLTEACGTCHVRDSSVLCSGETAAPAEFAQMHYQHRYLARQTLYHEGTPSLGLFLVCRGRIKVSRADRNGREQILRLVDQGGVLGEEALLDGSRYVGSARALEESQVAFVGREDLLRFLRTHEGMAVSLLLHLCRVLVSTQANLTRLALTDARSRMAGLLLDLGRQYGRPTPEGTELSLSISRGELAAMVGVAPETAMRLLSEFREAGIVRTDRRQVILAKPGRLEALT